MQNNNIINYESGFSAIGKAIPSHRLSNAYKTVKEILPNISTEIAMSIIGKAASHIEHDDCNALIGLVYSLDNDLKLIDVTGRYRLMAVLLTN